MGRFLILLLMIVVPARAAGRDLCEVLHAKGILTDSEYEECRRSGQEAAGRPGPAAEPAPPRPRWLDMLTPFGDVRVRQEGFYERGMRANNRTRLRVRLGLFVRPSKDVEAGVRLATGDPDDPISANQTFGREFTRKPINVDWAFLTLRSQRLLGVEHPWFAVTGGKFGVPAVRTSELVWDNDVSPEGAAQQLALLDGTEGIVRSVRLQAFQWTVEQVRTGSDPWMFGGQAAALLQAGTAAEGMLAAAAYNYQGLNAVARTALNPLSPFFNSVLANNNSMVVAPDGAVTAYRYGYNILNLSGSADVPEGFGTGVPAGLFFDLAYNSQAPRGNFGVYAGVRIGPSRPAFLRSRSAVVGEWALSYTWFRVEKDAVLSIFTNSNATYLQGNTPPSAFGAVNVVGSSLDLDYWPFVFLQLRARAFAVNAIDPALSNAPLRGNPTLVRTQFDAMVRF